VCDTTRDPKTNNILSIKIVTEICDKVVDFKMGQLIYIYINIYWSLKSYVKLLFGFLNHTDTKFLNKKFLYV
jgi:hypothetical protein